MTMVTTFIALCALLTAGIIGFILGELNQMRKMGKRLDDLESQIRSRRRITTPF